MWPLDSRLRGNERMEFEDSMMKTIARGLVICVLLLAGAGQTNAHLMIDTGGNFDFAKNLFQRVPGAFALRARIFHKLASALGDAAKGAARSKTFLGWRYHRLARRRGKQWALVAVGNSLLVIAWHLLPDPGARFADLGPDWHDRLAPLRRKRQLIAELERLSGKKVLLQEAA